MKVLKSTIALMVLIGSMMLVMLGVAAPALGQTLAADSGYQAYKLTNGMWELAWSPEFNIASPVTTAEFLQVSGSTAAPYWRVIVTTDGKVIDKDNNILAEVHPDGSVTGNAPAALRLLVNALNMQYGNNLPSTRYPPLPE